MLHAVPFLQPLHLHSFMCRVFIEEKREARALDLNLLLY
jgi:hypothetical protein